MSKKIITPVIIGAIVMAAGLAYMTYAICDVISNIPNAGI